VSRYVDLWAYANDATLDFWRPGKPTDNAFIETFNSKVRGECVNTHWFKALGDARATLQDWRRYCNEERPHSGIGQGAPILLHNPSGASSPPKGSEAENSGLN
jgi:putative transposase